MRRLRITNAKLVTMASNNAAHTIKTLPVVTENTAPTPAAPVGLAAPVAPVNMEPLIVAPVASVNVGPCSLAEFMQTWGCQDHSPSNWDDFMRSMKQWDVMMSIAGSPDEIELLRLEECGRYWQV
jgi:hypothetical protein